MNIEKVGILDSIKNSHSLRIFLIFFLVLLLQIPIEMIRGVLSERQNLSRNVTEDITSKWGKDQSIAGPYLVVPYQVEITEPAKDGKILTRIETRHAYFLPDTLQALGNVDCEVRYRGIYKVPVYQLNLKVSGKFSEPDFTPWGVSEDKILWDRAHLSVRISDVHAITDSATLTWNTESIGFLPGVGETNRQTSGIHALLASGRARGAHDFSFDLKLNGSQGLNFAPLGEETTVMVESNWTAPSFQGRWLPSERVLNDDGFEASWAIPFLGRNYPQTWREGQGLDEAIATSLFGVNFITPIDHYRMIQRSLKYKMLLIALTFATLWLLEVLFKFRIHVIQYLLMGAGCACFIFWNWH